MNKNIVVFGVIATVGMLIYQGFIIKDVSERLDTSLNNTNQIIMDVNNINSSVSNIIYTELAKSQLMVVVLH